MTVTYNAVIPRVDCNCMHVPQRYRGPTPLEPRLDDRIRTYGPGAYATGARTAGNNVYKPFAGRLTAQACAAAAAAGQKRKMRNTPISKGEQHQSTLGGGYLQLGRRPGREPPARRRRETQRTRSCNAHTDRHSVVERPVMHHTANIYVYTISGYTARCRRQQQTMAERRTRDC